MAIVSFGPSTTSTTRSAFYAALRPQPRLQDLHQNFTRWDISQLPLRVVCEHPDLEGLWLIRQCVGVEDAADIKRFQCSIFLTTMITTTTTLDFWARDYRPFAAYHHARLPPYCHDRPTIRNLNMARTVTPYCHSRAITLC